MTADPRAARLQKVFPVDLNKFLPEIVLRNYGRWVDRKFH
jgi:sulfite reductase beta subunit